MAAWRHNDARKPLPDEMLPINCRFCGTSMKPCSVMAYWPDIPKATMMDYCAMIRSFARVHGAWILEQLVTINEPYSEESRCIYCPCCGWWTGAQTIYVHTGTQIWQMHYGVTGELRKINPIEMANEPLLEIRKRLSADFDSRFSISSRKMEEVVRSIFADLGFRAELTAYSGDGGIDVILQAPDGRIIGVEIKRYRSSIEVSLIRSFVGALLLQGLTAGVFVTTSRFQSGARKAALMARMRGIKLSYVDGLKLFDLLKISQVQNPENYPTFLEGKTPRLRYVYGLHLNSL